MYLSVEIYENITPDYLIETTDNFTEKKPDKFTEKKW